MHLDAPKSILARHNRITTTDLLNWSRHLWWRPMVQFDRMLIAALHSHMPRIFHFQRRNQFFIPYSNILQYLMWAHAKLSFTALRSNQMSVTFSMGIWKCLSTNHVSTTFLYKIAIIYKNEKKLRVHYNGILVSYTPYVTLSISILFDTVHSLFLRSLLRQ